MPTLRKSGFAIFDGRAALGKVALAAAVLFLLASDVRATVVDFILVEPSSFLQQSNKIFGPLIGTHHSIEQVVGSDATNFYGHLYVDITPTTIQLMPGSNIIARPTGNYAPFDPVTSDPSVAIPGIQVDANYGLANPGFGVLEEQHDIRIDNGYGVLTPSSPMFRVGNDFNLSGQAMRFIDGRQATVSNLGGTTGSLVGQPFLAFGTAATDIGTWDGTTLILPVHSEFVIEILPPEILGGINEFLFVTGQLVAIPYVPEPSSFILLIVGMGGLAVAYGRQRRKRCSRGD